MPEDSQGIIIRRNEYAPAIRQFNDFCVLYIIRNREAGIDGTFTPEFKISEACQQQSL